MKDELYSAVIADILDSMGYRFSVLSSNIRPLKPNWRVFGKVATLSAVAVASEPEKPYALELDCIDALKPNDVLVATTNGHYGSALWGELLSTASRARGAVGVVMDGMTRDAAKIIEMDFPVFAAGFCPLDSKGRLDAVSYGKPIRIGECTLHQGDCIFGDIDGIVVIPAAETDKVLAKALEKVRGENKVREELARGRSAKDVFAEYGIL